MPATSACLDNFFFVNGAAVKTDLKLLSWIESQSGARLVLINSSGIVTKAFTQQA